MQMERNVVRCSGSARLRILTEEEWSRINDHLLTLDKLRNEAKLNDSGQIKTRVLPSNRPRTALKHDGLTKEQWNKRETLPMVESIGKTLISEKTREEIIKRAKAVLLENKDYSRRLLHGLKLSSVLHERGKQMDLARRLKNMMDTANNEIKMKVREEAKKYEEDMLRDKIRRKENIEKLRKELNKQISQKIEERQQAELDKVREGEDIVKMNEELKAVLVWEREERRKKRENWKKDIEDYTKSEREIRKNLIEKEEEQEEVNKIYQKVAWELDKRRRDKEKAKFRKAISICKDNFRDAKDPLKLHSDGDKQLKSFLLMREARKKALLNDLLANKKLAEEEMERRRNEEKVERRKCAAERCRKAEADRLRNLKEKEERRKLMNNMRKYYIMQWTEKKELQKEEKDLDKFYAPDFTEENKIIVDCCNEVLALAERHKRPVFPVAAAIKHVKKEFDLEPVKNLHFLKSNVPIGK